MSDSCDMMQWCIAGTAMWNHWKIKLNIYLTKPYYSYLIYRRFVSCIKCPDSLITALWPGVSLSSQISDKSPPPSVLSPCALAVWCTPWLVACLKDGFNFIPTQTFYATFFYVKKVRVTGVSAYIERITWSEGSLQERAKNKANIILQHRVCQ